MRPLHSIAIIVALGLLLPVARPSSAQTVQVGYHSRIDFTGRSSWAWLPGAPAFDPENQALIRSEVERRMSRLGWTRKEGSADLYLRSDVVGTVSQMVAALRVDLIAPDGETLVWRGLATGVVSPDRKRNRKTIKAAIAEMFKQFPRRPK